jgi:hypothetical protein
LIVVSDTSPVLNLARIGRLDLLRLLYQHVLIPAAVHDELLAAMRPLPTPIDFASLPWLTVARPSDRRHVEKLSEDLDTRIFSSWKRGGGGAKPPRPDGTLKPTGWVVDMRHYLDEETGDLPDGLPAPVLNLALFFGSIVAWVSDHLPQGDWHTNVPCRRSPSRRHCLGDIMAELDGTSGCISWQYPVCGDNGLIHGWEDTLWNRQGGVRAASSDTPPPTSD